jgi:hypothetical protein
MLQIFQEHCMYRQSCAHTAQEKKNSEEQKSQNWLGRTYGVAKKNKQKLGCSSLDHIYSLRFWAACTELYYC